MKKTMNEESVKAPMTKSEIIQWMKDAFVMIGEQNDEKKDEGKCLLGALIHTLESENPTEISSTEPEDTTAGVMMTLRQSTLQVISIGPEKELLHEIRVAPKGSWDKIWNYIKSIKSLK